MKKKSIQGAEKPDLHELPRIAERISFLYLERCLISRSDSAITVADQRGTVHIPAASIGVLLFGPGTNVSHRAMELIGDVGCSVLWVGEKGVRYYAHGRPLAHSSRLLVAQARLVSNTHSRLHVARMMYQMRFPAEDVSGLTMQQLRGREGARVRSAYRRASRESGIEWKGRKYDPDDFAGGDAINQALSAAHACMYGIAHSAIVAMGASPGLGFIHTGHERSFVYDIADLYKVEIALPVAFAVAAENPDDVGGVTRRAMRDAMSDARIMERAARDIRKLLLHEDSVDVPESARYDGGNVVHLWDEKLGLMAQGVSYRDASDEIGEHEKKDTAEDDTFFPAHETFEVKDTSSTIVDEPNWAQVLGEGYGVVIENELMEDG